MTHNNIFEPVEKGVICFIQGQETNNLTKQTLENIIKKSGAIILDDTTKTQSKKTQQTEQQGIGFLLQESDTININSDNNSLFKISTCGNIRPELSAINFCKKQKYESGLIIFYSGNELKNQNRQYDFNFIYSKLKFKDFQQIPTEFGIVCALQLTEKPIKINDHYIAMNLKNCKKGIVKQFEQQNTRNQMIPYLKIIKQQHIIKEYFFKNENQETNGYTALILAKDKKTKALSIHTTPEDNFVSITSINNDYDNIRLFSELFKPELTEIMYIAPEINQKNSSIISQKIQKTDFFDFYSNSIMICQTLELKN